MRAFPGLPRRHGAPLQSKRTADSLRSARTMPSDGAFLEIICGRGLVAKDVGRFRSGKSDPYVVASIGSIEYARTPVVRRSLDPDWRVAARCAFRDDFWAEVEGGDAELVLRVFDKDRFGGDDCMGEVRVPLGTWLRDHGAGVRVERTRAVAECAKSGTVSGELTFSFTALRDGGAAPAADLAAALAAVQVAEVVAVDGAAPPGAVAAAVAA